MQKRKQVYTHFLESFQHSDKMVNDIIRLGYHFMKKEKLHPHFFGNNSLLENVQYLTFYALQLPKEYNNPTYLNLKLTREQSEKILELFEKRISEKVPVEYITHEAFYSGQSFYVNSNVLVPRSIMNTQFNDFLNETKWENHRVLDLCTGSGCVGITLALLNPTIKVDLVDISNKALEVANINIHSHQLQNRVQCIQSDLFDNLQNQYDLIITNPPYVSQFEYASCPPEFKNEPRIALEAGIDGLDIIHKILLHSKSYLNLQGRLIAEVGVSAARRLKKLYPHIKFKWLKYKKPPEKKSNWDLLDKLDILNMFSLQCAFICEAKHLP